MFDLHSWPLFTIHRVLFLARHDLGHRLLPCIYEISQLPCSFLQHVFVIFITSHTTQLHVPLQPAAQNSPFNTCYLRLSKVVDCPDTSHPLHFPQQIETSSHQPQQLSAHGHQSAHSCISHWVTVHHDTLHIDPHKAPSVLLHHDTCPAASWHFIWH